MSYINLLIPVVVFLIIIRCYIALLQYKNDITYEDIGYREVRSDDPLDNL